MPTQAPITPFMSSMSFTVCVPFERAKGPLARDASIGVKDYLRTAHLFSGRTLVHQGRSGRLTDLLVLLVDRETVVPSPDLLLRDGEELCRSSRGSAARNVHLSH